MSTHLDPRQRAMLAEMHVRVWAPDAPAAPTASIAPAPAATTETGAPTVPTAPAATAERQAVHRPEVPMALHRPEGVAQMDWPSLQHTVAQCQACSLCRTRHQTVFGVGGGQAAGTLPQANWLIVGEAPGEHEDQQGEPFVGQAGKLLDNILTAMGLSRHESAPAGGVYITNALKCRPPGNRNPKPEEVAQCLPYLARQVALLQPKIILAMGRFAVQALLRDSVPDVDTIPLGKLRGQVHAYQNVPVVVTYHPAYVLRNLPEKAKIWADVCLAMAMVQGASNRP